MKRTCQAAISSAITCFRYVTFTCEWWDGKLVYSVWLLSRFSHLCLLSDQTGNSLWNILSETPPSLHTQTCTQLLYGLNGFSSRPVSISCVVSGSVSSMMSGTPCSVGVTLRFRWAVAWSSVSSSPFLTSAICDESGSWSPMSVWSEVLVCWCVFNGVVLGELRTKQGAHRKSEYLIRKILHRKHWLQFWGTCLALWANTDELDG